MSIKHKNPPTSLCFCCVLWRGHWGYGQKQETVLGKDSGGLAGEDSRQSYSLLEELSIP